MSGNDTEDVLDLLFTERPTTLKQQAKKDLADKILSALRPSPPAEPPVARQEQPEPPKEKNEEGAALTKEPAPISTTP